jgi:2-haloacid dehalogenase
VIVEWDLRVLYEPLIDDAAELDWFLANVVTEEWHYRHDAGEPLDELLAERTARFPDHGALIEAYRDRFLESIPGDVPGTGALIDRLAARRVPLYAITNFAAAFWDRFRPTRAVLEHFRAIVVSGKERLAKPDPAIFRLAADRFGHAPERMLFIDDSPANIAAARALGWQTHLFRNAVTLETELAGCGLL